MTYEEAKSTIIVQLTQARGTLECLPAKTKQESPLNDLIEAYILAIKALEKQIPKKIIYHDNCGNLTPNQPRCPRCYETANDTWHYAGESYCEYCGQLMKWRK